MKTDTRNLISVSDASNRGISGLVADAESGTAQVIIRNSKPAAAVVSIAELDRIEDMHENAILLIAALARELTDTGKRHDLDNIAADFGVDLSDTGGDEDEDGTY